MWHNIALFFVWILAGCGAIAVIGLMASALLFFQQHDGFDEDEWELKLNERTESKQDMAQ